MQDINHNGIPDQHEAKMAKADLYKLANYSMKLFKMINEGDHLEDWVKAKITKSADFIASVYHFMEYEMKTSEYGDALENAEMYSESVRRAFEQKLIEAKACKAKMAEKNKKLDEISNKTKASYSEKASADVKASAPKVAATLAKKGKNVTDDEVNNARKVSNRLAGQVRASTKEVEEGIEDKLAAAREKAAAKGKTKEKEEAPKSNTRKVAGNAYGGSKQKTEKEVELEESTFYRKKGSGDVVEHIPQADGSHKLVSTQDRHTPMVFSGKDAASDVQKHLSMFYQKIDTQKEDINKSDVPAYKRKASGAKDWKVSQADLDKEANNPKNISSKAGLAKLKKDRLGETLKKKVTEGTLVEFAMDVIKHPKYGKIEWLNHGGAHMIATTDPVTGSLKIHAMGSQEQIAAKWRKLKDSIAAQRSGVVESFLNKVIQL